MNPLKGIRRLTDINLSRTDVTVPKPGPQADLGLEDTVSPIPRLGVIGLPVAASNAVPRLLRASAPFPTYLKIGPGPFAIRAKRSGERRRL